MTEIKNLTILPIDDFEKELTDNKIFDEINKEKKDYVLNQALLQDPKTMLNDKLFDTLPARFRVDLLTANNAIKLLRILRDTYHLALYQYEKNVSVKFVQNNGIIFGNGKIVSSDTLETTISASLKDLVIDFNAGGRTVKKIECIVRNKQHATHKVYLTMHDISNTRKQFKLMTTDTTPYFQDFILSRMTGTLGIRIKYELENDSISVTPIRIITQCTTVIPTGLSKFLLESLDNKTKIKCSLLSGYVIVKKKMNEDNIKSFKMSYTLYKKECVQDVKQIYRHHNIIIID